MLMEKKSSSSKSLKLSRCNHQPELHVRIVASDNLYYVVGMKLKKEMCVAHTLGGVNRDQ